MRRILVAALACGILAVGIPVVRAQESARRTQVSVPKGAEEVWRLEGERRKALLAGDLKTLESFCADEMTYSHTNGKVDTKKTYFESLRSGVRYETMDFSDVNIAVYDSTVIITGLAKIAVKSPSGPTGFQARFTDVWVKQREHWRFAAWHTTRLPE
jgi:hypothetical protein